MAFRFAPLLRRTVTAVARSQKAVPNVAPSLVRGTALVATPVAMRSTTRLFTSSANANVLKSNKWAYYTLFTIATGTAYYQFKDSALAEKAKVDYAKVREAIEKLLDEEGYDDGSYGPVFVRLAWHASGTYDAVNTQTGGSNGATMRFTPECKHGANAGLDVARNRLEAVKKQFPEISYADLWTLAGAVAIETMGGPKINWTPGRSDAESGKACPPDGRLPDASKEHDHVRAIFYRMGFNDREIVALVGAHALGRCHKNRSGYDGPWTNSPTSFSNDFFIQLLERKWTPKKWDGPLQYEDESGALMMLPADLALIKDPEFKKYVEMYAKDEELYFKDFSAAFAKLMELGVPRKAAKSGWFW